PNCRGCSSAESYTLLAVRRRNCAHRVAKACSDRGRSKAWASLLGHSGSEIDNRNCNSARARDSFMGEFLPGALLPVMGARLLLLREQLFHCRIWRSGSSVQMATLRASGGDNRRADVWNIGQCSFALVTRLLDRDIQS